MKNTCKNHRNIKQILACLLTLAMVVTVLPAAVFADETEEIVAYTSEAETESVAVTEETGDLQAVEQKETEAEGETSESIQDPGEVVQAEEEPEESDAGSKAVEEQVIAVPEETAESDTAPETAEGQETEDNAVKANETKDEEAEAEVKAAKAEIIKLASAELSYTTTDFTGKQKRPGTTVKAIVNGEEITLTRGKDYTVTYSNNVHNGTAKAVITGIGNCTGTITKTFTINRVDIKSVKLETAILFYTGSALTQNVTVYALLDGNTVGLKNGTHCTVTFTNNTEIGIATVTVSGKGNYKGTITKTFQIRPNTVKVTNVFSPSAGWAKVEWEKAGGNVDGYQIWFSEDESFTAYDHCQVAGTVAKKVRTTLMPGRSYFVKVRAFKKAGRTLYGPWSELATVSVLKKEFNYLAIGNSITSHGICDYWWNNIGMAASTAEKDYVHQVTKYLEDTYGDTSSRICSFVAWETATERTALLSLLDPYLDQKLNLVTIELSENVGVIDTFERDFSELVSYVKGKAPKAQLLIIDDFWDKGEKAAIKRRIANQFGLPFADLSEIKWDPEYQCGVGTTVYDAEGNPHIVEHSGDRENPGVAEHPGDLGMEYIANSVIRLIK